MYSNHYGFKKKTERRFYLRGLFWKIKSCNLSSKKKHFGEACCFHRQGRNRSFRNVGNRLPKPSQRHTSHDFNLYIHCSQKLEFRNLEESSILGRGTALRTSHLVLTALSLLYVILLSSPYISSLTPLFLAFLSVFLSSMPSRAALYLICIIPPI